MASPLALRRLRVAWLLRALRDQWKCEGERGKWARFRMAWLMDKRLGLLTTQRHTIYNRRPDAG